MKNKVLNRVNILLGILVAFFAGCNSQKHVAKDRGPEAKYGVPQEILDQWERENKAQLQDTTAQAGPEQTPAQAVESEEEPAQKLEPVEEPAPAPVDPQPKKYGPLPPSRD